MPNSPDNYWASSPYPSPVEYPKWAFHATEEAKMVKSPEDFAKLGEGWSFEYIKKSYPKTKFKAKAGEVKPGDVWYDTTVVATPEDEGKLEGGWGDTMPPDPNAEPVAAVPAKTLSPKAK